MTTRRTLGLLLISAVLGVLIAFGVRAAVLGPTAPENPPHSPGSTAGTAAPSTVSQNRLGVDNLVTDDDVAGAVTSGIGTETSRGTGDLQYAITACMEEPVSDLTGQEVFSGSWPVENGGIVSQSVSRSTSEVEASRVIDQLLVQHQEGCSADQALHEWVTLVENEAFWGRLGSSSEWVAVVRAGDRIAILAAASDSIDSARFEALAVKAHQRLG